jgi:hypothetical protein
MAQAKKKGTGKETMLYEDGDREGIKAETTTR